MVTLPPFLYSALCARSSRRNCLMVTVHVPPYSAFCARSARRNCIIVTVPPLPLFCALRALRSQTLHYGYCTTPPLILRSVRAALAGIALWLLYHPSPYSALYARSARRNCIIVIVPLLFQFCALRAQRSHELYYGYCTTPIPILRSARAALAIIVLYLLHHTSPYSAFCVWMVQ